MRSIFPCTVIFSFCLFNLVVSLRTETIVNIKSSPQHGHVSKDLNSLIESKGYHQEIHHIITRDGYILGTYRIRDPKFSGDRPPIVLLHSWLQSHVVFFMSENGIKSSKNTAPNSSDGLAFDLANLGFDVWLLNLRGNYYSTNHTTYKPQRDGKFWQFTLQDFALKDIPDCLDFIQKITRSETLGFVGLGQGATLALWLLAERPSYARILRPLIILNPLTDANQIRTYVKFLNLNYVQSVLGSITGPLLIRNALLEQFVDQYCSTNKLSYQCSNFYDQIGVRASNSSITKELAKYFPSGTSFGVGNHQVQILNQNDLAFYDGGIFLNLCRYKQFGAPKIKWNQISSDDIAVFAVSNEVRTLNGRLIVFGRVLKDKLVEFKKFGIGQYTTLDILLNRDIRSSMLDRISNLMSKYHQTEPQTTDTPIETPVIQTPNIVLRIHPPIVPTSVPPQAVLPPPPSTTVSPTHPDMVLNIIESPPTTPSPPAVTPKPKRLKVTITKDGFE